MESEKSLLVRMSRTQLLMMRTSLNQSRLSCDETDCFMCCEYGELERRINVALNARK